MTDENDQIIYQKRLRNELELILEKLEPFKDNIQGIVVESTYNWYWLVDGLIEAGYTVHLAHITGIQQYSGLKYTDDNHDARWLAHMLRIGVLMEGYIYPKKDRAIRDLLRKRSQMVKQKVSQMLAMVGLFSRNTGKSVNANYIRKLTEDEIDKIFSDSNLAFAMKSNLAVMRCTETQIEYLEQQVLQQGKLKPEFKQLKTASGIGNILALTIMLETGDIRRFSKAGNYSSYCRSVEGKKISNGKKKGKGNSKNGNKYLAWAFMEAANFAIRYNPKIKQFYQRKMGQTNKISAINAVGHKLSRACYYMMRDQVPFDVDKAFV